MEIRARYVQMGAFTLAVLAAAFAFVYWLNNSGSLRSRAIYQVRFEGSVAGLLTGSAVLFNGIRVGEVTALDLNPADARQVLATIAIARATPVRTDTTVGIDFQGLTGSPVIALAGGSSSEPLVSARGGPALLVADKSAGQSMSQAAREALRRIDALLAENAQPVKSMIANLDTFAAALARNSERVDGIVAGIERMTGGAKARVATYDLVTPRVTATLPKALGIQVTLAEPTALASLDSDKIQRSAPGGSTTPLVDAQWSDTLPKLVQTKLLRAFEDANTFAGVSRPLDGLSVDYQLLIDIRSFQLAAMPAEAAEIELAGKILDGKGKIVATRVFAASAPVAGRETPAAIAAFQQAFPKVAADFMAWATTVLREQAERPDTPLVGAPKKTPAR